MTKLVRNHSHWGAFLAEVEDGRVVGVRPFERDPEPSPIIEAVPDAVYSKTRVAQPMCARRLAQERPGFSGEGRGREPFVPVSWERALDLVAGELTRVKRDHGHDAIMAGSQGWGSAGIFHEARGQLRRFMANLRRLHRPDLELQLRHGAGVPAARRLATPSAAPGRSHRGRRLRATRKLMVMFGGANPKNMQVTKGGMRRARDRSVACRTCQRRRQGRQCQPDPRGRARSDRAPMDRDPARDRHRDAVGADAHADRQRAARSGISRALLHRLRARAAVRDGRERRPAEGRRLGRARSPAFRRRPSARWRAKWRPTAP